MLGPCPPAVFHPGRCRCQCPPQGAGQNRQPDLAAALEAVHRIDALFDIERSINGQSAEQRRAVRQELSTPLVADLEERLCEQRPKLSRGNDLAKAVDYMLKRWPAFTRFLPWPAPRRLLKRTPNGPIGSANAWSENARASPTE